MSGPIQTSLLLSAVGIGLFIILLLLIAGLAAALARVQPAPQKARPDRRAVVAPGGGCVLSISVQPGGVVVIGQELCILEIDQAKTAVRAGRMGVISSVHITPGDPVQPGQVLMEFGD